MGLGLRSLDRGLFAQIFQGALVAVNAVRLVRETTHVLMQGSPPGIDAHAIEETVRSVAGVRDLHDLHLWRVSDGVDVVTVHVVVGQAADGTSVSQLVTEAIRERFGIVYTTVQPEIEPEIEPEITVGRGNEGLEPPRS